MAALATGSVRWANNLFLISLLNFKIIFAHLLNCCGHILKVARSYKTSVAFFTPRLTAATAVCLLSKYSTELLHQQTIVPSLWQSVI